jgi:hypothetical protein
MRAGFLESAEQRKPQMTGWLSTCLELPFK